MNVAERFRSGLALFDATLFTIGGQPVTISSLVTVLVVVAVSFWLARLIERAVQRIFVARGYRLEGTAGAASRLTYHAVLVTGLAVAVTSLGIDLTALFAAGAIFAVAIGFAMQNIAQNFVSGIILLLERTIKPGDVLEVGGELVKVRELGIRSTVARTLDEEDVILPNSDLVAAAVKNFTLRDPLFRLRATVGVVYSADMAAVRRVLEETAAALEWRNRTVDPRILLIGFGSSSVDFEVSVWVDEPWQQRSLRSRLNEAIWWALKDAGITIAFPQLDVHFDPPVTGSLESLAANA